jgi:TRAP-type C4-dicarboxylate transport system permease large subunit
MSCCDTPVPSWPLNRLIEVCWPMLLMMIGVLFVITYVAQTVLLLLQLLR